MIATSICSNFGGFRCGSPTNSHADEYVYSCSQNILVGI